MAMTRCQLLHRVGAAAGRLSRVLPVVSRESPTAWRSAAALTLAIERLDGELQ